MHKVAIVIFITLLGSSQLSSMSNASKWIFVLSAYKKRQKLLYRSLLLCIEKYNFLKFESLIDSYKKILSSRQVCGLFQFSAEKNKEVFLSILVNSYKLLVVTPENIKQSFYRAAMSGAERSIEWLFFICYIPKGEWRPVKVSSFINKRYYFYLLEQLCKKNKLNDKHNRVINLFLEKLCNVYTQDDKKSIDNLISLAAKNKHNDVLNSLYDFSYKNNASVGIISNVYRFFSKSF